MKRQESLQPSKQLIKTTLLIGLLTILFSTSLASAWDNCPFGEVNEPYPGTCGRYIDTDRDGLCDYSQPSPSERGTITIEPDDNLQAEQTNTDVESESTGSRINYYFIPIALILFVLYGITYTLSNKKKIKRVQHRKIWNVLLLITFLVSGIFGITLALLISYGIRLSFYSDLLFWHVEFGISMAMISLFHVAWHWKYYKNMVVKKS